MSKEELRLLVSSLKASRLAEILDAALSDDGANFIWYTNKETATFWSLLQW